MSANITVIEHSDGHVDIFPKAINAKPCQCVFALPNELVQKAFARVMGCNHCLVGKKDGSDCNTCSLVFCTKYRIATRRS